MDGSAPPSNTPLKRGDGWPRRQGSDSFSLLVAPRWCSGGRASDQLFQAVILNRRPSPILSLSLSLSLSPPLFFFPSLLFSFLLPSYTIMEQLLHCHPYLEDIHLQLQVPYQAGCKVAGSFSFSLSTFSSFIKSILS